MRVLFFISFFLIVFVSGSITCAFDNRYCNELNKTKDTAFNYFENKHIIENSAPTLNFKSIVTTNRPTDEKSYILYNIRYQNYAALIDKDQHEIHRWQLNFSQAFANPKTFIQRPVPDSLISWDKSQLLPNGDLIVTFIARGDTPYGYGMVKMDKNSNVLWAYPAHVHHDFYIDKTNGHIFALTHEFVKNPIPGLESLSYPILTDFIVELSPQGVELKKISLLEAFVNSPYKEFANTRQPYGKAWDHTHSNSIMKLEPGLAAAFPTLTPGQLLISVRNLDTIAVLDMEKNSIAVTYTGPWRAQHSASFLANGNILLFDNRGMKNHRSRVIEFNPKTHGIEWSYGSTSQETFFSFAYGEVMRLSNGNTFINSTQESRMFEVEASGKKIWEFKLPAQYALINNSLPPYSPNTQGINPEEIGPDYNLATAIISARPYKVEELPFLKEGIH